MSTEARKLSTIQKRENLDDVFAVDQPGPGNACYKYRILKHDSDEDVATIQFQCGPRNAEDSVHGVQDADLLEIVRDRFKGFQSGEFSSRENACALTHIEEALMWLNRRLEDRIELRELCTHNK